VEEEDKLQAPSEAEALLEIARAIRSLPRAMAESKRPKRTGIHATLDNITRLTTGIDPEVARERRREADERAEARRAEKRANIAIAIAALAAIGSILGAVFH
jgi:hypothetical protein